MEEVSGRGREGWERSMWKVKWKSGGRLSGRMMEG